MFTVSAVVVVVVVVGVYVCVCVCVSVVDVVLVGVCVSCVIYVIDVQFGCLYALSCLHAIDAHLCRATPSPWVFRQRAQRWITVTTTATMVIDCDLQLWRWLRLLPLVLLHVTIHINTYIYNDIYIYMYVYTHVYMSTHLCACMCMYVHIYIYIYIYMYMYMYIYIYRERERLSNSPRRRSCSSPRRVCWSWAARPSGERRGLILVIRGSLTRRICFARSIEHGASHDTGLPASLTAAAAKGHICFVAGGIHFFCQRINSSRCSWPWDRVESPESGRGSGEKYGHPRTNIVGFRGFDSSMILIQRGGILMSIGDFPESLSQAMLVGCNVRRIGCSKRGSDDLCFSGAHAQRRVLHARAPLFSPTICVFWRQSI